MSALSFPFKKTEKLRHEELKVALKRPAVDYHLFAGYLELLYPRQHWPLMLEALGTECNTPSPKQRATREIVPQRKFAIALLLALRTDALGGRSNISEPLDKRRHEAPVLAAIQ